MASYIDNPKKLDWAMSFQRTGKFPLDRSSIFDSYADAVAYAKGDGSDSRAIGGASYVGQIVTVFENDVVTVYKIEADRTLGEVGRATEGDEKSIHLNDTVLELFGFDAATSGQQVRVKVDTETGAKSLEWYTPDSSTVEGLQASVSALKSTVGDEESGLVKDMIDVKQDIVTINGKLTGALHYKGSCAFADLPAEGNETGDVWNVTDAGGTDAHGQAIHAGDNVIWNGTGWDVSTGTIDLSAYYTSAQVDTKVDGLKTDLEAKIDDVANAATKVVASETNGNIKVDDAEVTVYTLPTASEEAKGGIKVAAAGTADKVVLDASGVAGIDKVSADKIDGVVAEAAKVSHAVTMGTKTFDGSADVTFTADDVPLPTDVVRTSTYGTDAVAGAVKSSAEKDQIAIGTDGKMNVNTISASKVDGVVAEAAKVSHKVTMGTKSFDGTEDVTFTTDDLPLPDNLVKKTDIATAEAAGLVKSSADKDQIAVSESGIMSLNAVSGSKVEGAVAEATNTAKLGNVAASDILVADSETNLTAKVKSAAAADQLKEAKAITLSGDATGTANFDGTADAEIAVTLADSGVTAGAYTKVTVDAKGRVTAGGALAASDIPDLTLEKITDAGALAAKSKVARTDIDEAFEAQVADLEAKAHTHDNKTVLDGISSAKVTAWDNVVDNFDDKANKATTLSGYGIEDAYTKTEIDGKLGGAFHYKGSVDAFTDLPAEDQQIGDVYNIATAGGTDANGTAIKAGDNVAWNGTGWDVLSGTTDLSAYDTRTQVEEKISAAKTELQGNIDAATGRIDTLESVVGNAEGGLVKDVADLKTSEAAQNTKIADLETTVGKAATETEAATGLVKKVADNTDAIAVLNGDENTEGSVKKQVNDLAQLVENALNELESEDGEIASMIEDHNQSTTAHTALFAAKQNKIFQQALTVTIDAFTAATESDPGEFVGSFTLSGIDSTKAYKIDVVPVINDTATHKAIVAANFLPMVSYEAGVLKMYAMAAPTVNFNVTLTFTEVQ